MSILTRLILDELVNNKVEATLLTLCKDFCLELECRLKTTVVASTIDGINVSQSISIT